MVASEKRTLRERILLERLRLTAEERALRSEAACHRLLQLEPFTRARAVALYSVLGSEADPACAAHALLASGRTLAYPRVVDGSRTLRFARCAPEDLLPGPMKTLVPPESAPDVRVDELDCVVVPGVAFDAEGGRLGRGRGFYDATLASLPARVVRVGLAFELQLVPAVPGEPHDVEVDWIVTEERAIRAGPAADGGVRRPRGALPL